MSLLRRLLQVGSITESAGVYVSAMAMQKGLAFARVLLFAYLMTHAKLQYQVWGLGLMILTIGAPLLTLGSSHGLTRYVSLYEARGRLREFLRRMGKGVLICVAVMTAVALLASGWVTRLVISPCISETAFAYREQLWICWAALGNAMLMALYHNLLGFLSGLRVFRMLSVLEIAFNVAFTLLGVGALMIERTALGLLLAHFAALAMTVGLGMVLLRLAVRHLSQVAEHVARAGDENVVLEPAESDEPADTVPQVTAPAARDGGAEGRSIFTHALRFGVIAMVSNLIWLSVGYVSFWLTSKGGGRESEGANVLFFMKLGQPITYLANAAWVVVYTYVARQWERRQRDEAMLVLDTAYKALCLIMMTVTVAVYLASPLWVRLLPVGWQAGQPLLGGVLLFYQMLVQLALLNILASLNERPIAFALAGIAAGAVNVALALVWMPLFAARSIGATWAAGTGVFVGGVAVTVAYLLLTRTKVRAGTYAVLVAPVLLLATVWTPVWVVAAVWAVVLVVAIGSPWIFTVEQKQILRHQVVKVRSLLGGKRS